MSNKRSTAEKRAEREVGRAAKKAAKKIGPAVLALFFAFLVVGAAAGAGTMRYLTRSDEFTLNGEASVTLAVGEEYVEAGCRLVSFGRDRGDKVAVEIYRRTEEGEETASAVDTASPAEYVIVYRANDLRFGKNFMRVRTVKVGEANDGEA